MNSNIQKLQEANSGNSLLNKLFFTGIISLWIATIAFVTSPLVGSCQNTGNSGSQVRNVSGFTGISMDLSADLIISQGNDFYVEVSAKPDIIDKIVTEKEGSNLIIKYRDNKSYSSGDNSIRITVRLPKLNSLKLNGSGKVMAQTDFTTDKLSLQLNGSGDIDMKNISASSLSAQINGSGDIIRISGSVNDVELQVNGSGNLHGETLTGKSVSVEISGSGDVTIGVTDALDVEIVGSGDVNYKGNPSSVKTAIVGSGNLNHR